MNLVRSESETEFDLSGYDRRLDQNKMEKVCQQGLSRFVNQRFSPNAKDLVDF